MATQTILTSEWIEWAKQQTEKFTNLEGFVAGEGGSNPKILLLGEAPGAKEIELGHPFQGPSGKELDRWLDSLSLTREDVYIFGVVSARPFRVGKSGLKSDRRPNNAEVKAFAPMFDYELSQFKNKLLVTMGNASLQRLLGKTAKVGDLHGRIMHESVQKYNEVTDRFEWTETKYDIFPLYHPSYSKRFKAMKSVVDEDSTKLREYLATLK
ncbi:uracil-DNA glycosylase [Lentilactobacillus kosonis]|uniref:Uracil-DNA glycosylase family protein, clostridial type n=1 Tax=Lentilactobacillus kosonis TaxID=2810561 RepID=A0A401FIK9_9LACO|nr:uracil-DNA glycosylase [Lentilactobacillus kosonis]GAY72204.1 uracil-DNA glycosylase family protein, clostridial type [Lentilactobacillus kosonis]